ncbi:hypothetical protein [Amycolatopsis sp. NPDC054798]
MSVLLAMLSDSAIPIAGFGAVISYLLTYIGRRRTERPDEEQLALPPRPTLTDRINQLRDNLASSASLIDEINAELKLQTTALERVRAEAEENQRLVELNKAQADAVREVMAKAVHAAQQQAARKGSKQQWWFFGAGLAFSIPLGVGVNYLYDLIAH